MDTRASKDREGASGVARQGAEHAARQGAENVARQGAENAARQGAGHVSPAGGHDGDADTIGRKAAPTGREGVADASRQEVSRIERLCIDRGLKMTGQRRLIARVLSDSADHPDVEELYRRAVAQDSRISIATVYRTARLLEEKGILERRDFGGNRARYDQADRGHHYHLIDVESGKVIEFADPRHETLAREIAERLGFDLVEHRLELFGRRFDAAQDTAQDTPGGAPAPTPRDRFRVSAGDKADPRDAG